METMIVADASMFKAFGGKEIELRSYLLSVMSVVSWLILFKSFNAGVFSAKSRFASEAFKILLKPL